jgi:hypothetical protein
MSPWAYALWGAFGGLSIEGIQFYGAIRRTGRWPWKIKGEPRPLPLFVSVVIRVGVGFGLALAAAETGQVSGPLGAIAVGIAAPLLIEQMAKRVPLDAQSSIEPGGKGAS